MKNHFISLFYAENLRKTIILLVIAALLISVSLLVGISDNIPMIGMLLAGIIVLYFAILHTWEKAAYFAILLAICVAILILDFIKPFVSEGIAMTLGFISFTGVIAGIIGIFTRLKGWQRLPYSGSLLSLVALGIYISSINIPLKEIITPGSEWILIGLQLLITFLLFGIGVINKRDSLLTKAILIISGIVLILLGIWGFYASMWQFGEAVHSIGFVILATRVYASIEIIIASLSLYACK